MTKTLVIDPLQPIALLDVDNVIENEYWKWCADDVMDENNEFLPDEALTYLDFEIRPTDTLPAGTTVVMPYLWGFGPDHMTAPVDYEVTLDKPATAARVVHVILSAYHGALEAEGGNGRHFYIEEVSTQSDGKVQISWGT